MGERADVRQGVARGVQTLKLDAAAHADDVARRKADIDSTDTLGGACVCKDARLGCPHEARISAGVIAVLVRIQDLPDLPTARLRCGKATLPVERVHGERLTGFPAGDEIVEIAKRVSRPDPFDEHVSTVPAKCAARHNGGDFRSDRL